MSLRVLALVLTAAVLHACWNLLSKKARGKTPFIWLVYTASSIVYLPVVLYQLSESNQLISQALLWFSLSSAILHLAYYIVLQRGYRSADLSVVYPLARGTGPLFSSAAAILFMSEHPDLRTISGLFLIIAGVLVITGLSFGTGQNRKMTAGLTYGVLTGLFIALYTVNDAIAVKSYTISPLVLTFGTNLLGAALLFPFIRAEKDELKREIKLHKWVIVAIAVMSPAAYMLVLEALKYAPLTVVAPARETSILLGVFMGSRVFDEKDLRRRLVASVLILGGIVMLSLG
ncbi:DMT family transporter [Dyadobacter pollutisoli]|jgi:drug/metabolite transporter (DMT)-like permease|uniref:DMT family transporter n=1 Tax=Dyadobacter pollutisoli TaxID=2910158 RepID=A0A9E8SIR6_9BACT|nr:DMT family transporter [Dyadobacter pollutisoli]WAC10083.1 DMT family transporter [Dyadobacter pollutisoli]